MICPHCNKKITEKRAKLTKMALRRINAMRKRGHTYDSIAETLGLSRSSVYNGLKQTGWL